MVHTVNPAIEAFLAGLPESFDFAQVIISRRPHAFELRHVADRVMGDADLELMAISDLRGLANYTADGAFRPLKSAPTLRSGWRILVAEASELGLALDHLYPGALADWYALREGNAKGVAYRDYVNRQTGMYRITQMLSDEQVGDVATAACSARFCLKRRLWHGPSAVPEAPAGKSVIPCLEPCPMLLEFARKSMRLEQEEKAAVQISSGDLATLITAVEAALNSHGEDAREADFAAAGNPRRLLRVKLLLERWLVQVPKKEEKE